ncbi:MAG: hypothetical protein GF329_05630 [Candidatus Lokiarchaeota archaeon]|nr:hypothetical protein [Candidatus Lokiarchaeota archaeon]
MSKFRIEKFYKNGRLCAFEASLIGKIRVEVNESLIVIKDKCLDIELNPYAYYWLSNTVFGYVTNGWKPPARFKDEAHHKLISWFNKKVAKVNGKKLYNVWLELLESIDPTKRKVAKALLSANWNKRGVGLDFLKQIDRGNVNTYLLNDVQNYVAAAQLAAHLPEHFIKYGLDWMELFAKDEKVGRSLRRTLANMPNNISWATTSRLSQIILERPLFKKAELVTTCHTVRMGHRSSGLFTPLAMRASLDQIREAGFIWKGDKLNIRKTSELIEATRYITDYPERCESNWVALARRSRNWHRELYNNEFAQQSPHDSLKDEEKTKKPLIDLPNVEGIEFMETVGRIRQESIDMNNCVKSYAPSACNGNCYLFHVDYEGKRATVEVSPRGRVVQVYGPRNSKNIACNYARKHLNKWGKLLK